ncbi:MAG: hypothetical protein M9962_10105 [Oligoflexia bacterium]|nr:hypothetical protein [Oligoflexia bacterium]
MNFRYKSISLFFVGVFTIYSMPELFAAGQITIPAPQPPFPAPNLNFKMTRPMTPEEIDALKKKLQANSGSTDVVSQQTANIEQVGQASFYFGVVQSAAGVTQISEAAQEKAKTGSTEEVQKLFYNGLQNLSSGTNQIQQAKEIINYADGIKDQNNSYNSVSSNNTKASEASSSDLLNFKRSNMGASAQKVLEKMEQVTDISAEEFIKTVNDEGNVYEVAAKAKGLNLKPEELKQVADKVATDYFAKYQNKKENTQLTAGVSFSDLMKDLDSFIKSSTSKSVDEISREIASSGVSESKENIIIDNVVSTNSESDFSGRIDEENPYIKSEKAILIKHREYIGDGSVFGMVKKQYQKRLFEFTKPF